jgi:hypothetical protein
MTHKAFTVKGINFRALKVAGFAALAGGSISLFGSAVAHAAVLSVGPSNPPYGGVVCADVNSDSQTSGTKVQAYDCSAGPNQQYQLIGETIYTVGGQRCLDVFAGGTAAGSKVDSATCNGTAAQKWY